MNSETETGTYTTVMDSDEVKATPVRESKVEAPQYDSDSFITSFIKETVTDNLDVLIRAQDEKQKRLDALLAEVVKEKEALRLIASRMRLTQKTLDINLPILRSAVTPAKRLDALQKIERVGCSLEHLAKELGIKVKKPVTKKPNNKKKPNNSTSE